MQWKPKQPFCSTVPILKLHICPIPRLNAFPFFLLYFYFFPFCKTYSDPLEVVMINSKVIQFGKRYGGSTSGQKAEWRRKEMGRRQMREGQLLSGSLSEEKYSGCSHSKKLEVTVRLPVDFSHLDLVVVFLRKGGDVTDCFRSCPDRCSQQFGASCQGQGAAASIKATDKGTANLWELLAPRGVDTAHRDSGWRGPERNRGRFPSSIRGETAWFWPLCLFHICLLIYHTHSPFPAKTLQTTRQTADPQRVGFPR